MNNRGGAQTAVSQINYNLSVRVADIGVEMICSDPELRMRLDGAMNSFRVAGAEADVSLNVGWAKLAESVVNKPAFDSGALWSLYREGDSYLFRFATPVYGRTPYREARFNRDFTKGEVLLHRPFFAGHPAIYPLEYPLDELLIINLLARGRGVEVHSCGLIDETGKSYLFIGQSGAGKTTTARLWLQQPGVRVLSDDRIILRKEGGRIWMHGTPWHGEAELSLPEKAPLDHIFFLKQWPHNEIIPLNPAETAARLVACGFPTFYYPPGLEFTLNFYEEVARCVPCYELRFVPEQSAVELVRACE
jgi:hypothetical protein